MSLLQKYGNRVSLFLAPVLLAVTMSPSISSAKTVKKVDYVALGDSLAAGQTPYKEIGKGYADYISDYLDNINYLGSYSKAFAVPGYTTTNVLEDIEENVEKGDADIQTSIKDAEVITLDAGANDLLQEITITPSGIAFDEDAIKQTLKQVGSNLDQILEQIDDLNSDADVYVMGYYNAFPYLPDPLQKQLDPFMEFLNTTIKKSAGKARVTFVPTIKVMAEDFRTYLPNPQDIHPSEEGYEVLAIEFWKEIQEELPLDKLIVDQRKVTLEKGDDLQLTLTAVYKNEAEEDATTFANWSSTNKRIAEVVDGHIVAKKKGSTVVKARYGGKTISISVKIK